MKLWLTNLVYKCPFCGKKLDIPYRRIKDIRQTIEHPCTNINCPSNTGNWEVYRDD